MQKETDDNLCMADVKFMLKKLEWASIGQLKQLKYIEQLSQSKAHKKKSELLKKLKYNLVEQLDHQYDEH